MHRRLRDANARVLSQQARGRVNETNSYDAVPSIAFRGEESTVCFREQFDNGRAMSRIARHTGAHRPRVQTRP